jgi:enoyl-CoA hydratase
VTSVQVEWPDAATAVLRLSRPDRLNALTHEMLDELTAGLREAAASEQARAVILTGAGRAFCAGVDIAGAAERGRSEPSPARRYVRQEHFADTIRSVRNCRLPVIAAVNGPAAGAGMALALASDIRIAAHGARFLIGAPRLALSAGECGISWLLPRIIGPGRAFEIMLTNREIPASQAAEIGLVTQLTEPDDLVPAALAVAVEIARNSPFGVTMTKKAAWAALDLSFDAAVELENRTQMLALATDDSAEAHQAFLEKRAPRWQGQ